jgi:histidine triad (HIT) family protein
MAEDKTLFEKIRDGEIPADVVYQDDHCLCFRDISPQAPQHLLLVPKRAIPRLTASEAADVPLLGHLLHVSARIAADFGFAESGYRVVINNGPDGGEEVPHLHLHLLAGRPLQWPPG